VTPTVGDRVALVECDDPYTKLEPGERGTVSFIDDMGTVFVDWDSGSRLGLLPDRDKFVLLPTEP